jgi:hypothetical protein
VGVAGESARMCQYKNVNTRLRSAERTALEDQVFGVKALRGGMFQLAKPLYGLTPVPRVRIPPSPPDVLAIPTT